jgi:hypothetical protein
MFSLPELFVADSQKNLGFRHVSKLLSSKRNKLEDQIIASIQWAGRATVDARKEEAFLLYAIALESLVLADKDPRELTYRLQVRVAHLLGKDIKARQEIFSTVGRLYGVRSQIVHSGHYQVVDSDLSLIRAFAKSCIIRICTSDPFVGMSTPKDLAEWFQEQVFH